jgi:hypothetical protein
VKLNIRLARSCMVLGFVLLLVPTVTFAQHYNGKVLFVGNVENDGTPADAELYDAAAGTS